VREVLFHIPHSSTLIPNELRDDFCLSDSELIEEIRLMTDWHTSELFRRAVQGLGHSIEFPVSRILMDPERFPDDTNELMSKVGMGMIYTKTSHGKPLRYNQAEQDERRQQLLNRYYLPHHDELMRTTTRAIDQGKTAIIIDCHSFPSIPLPYEFVQNTDRPEICIGTDDFHTPDWLKDNLLKEFETLGYLVSVNTPFSGSLTPHKFYQKDKRVCSIMIEINRSLYMDEITTERVGRFENIANDIENALRKSFDNY
jgi:N-formylglutamate deformylase